MVTPGGRCLDLSKLIILIIFEPLWVCAAIGIILISNVSYSQFGKRLGAGDMSIFGSYFPLHVTNNVFSY